MRWADDYHLFILGALSFASAYFGRTAARRRWRQWPRLHLTGMGASYILLLTAFYVDNGKNLPLWRELPEIAFWLLPSAIGIPLIIYALLRHSIVLAFLLRLDFGPRNRRPVFLFAVVCCIIHFYTKWAFKSERNKVITFKGGT